MSKEFVVLGKGCSLGGDCPVTMESVETPDLVEAIRDYAWRAGLNVHRDKSKPLQAYAHKHSLGPPLTRLLWSFQIGDKLYLVQGFLHGIVFCSMTKPDLIMHINW